MCPVIISVVVLFLSVNSNIRFHCFQRSSHSSFFFSLYIRVFDFIVFGDHLIRRSSSLCIFEYSMSLFSEIISFVVLPLCIFEYSISLFSEIISFVVLFLSVYSSIRFHCFRRSSHSSFFFSLYIRVFDLIVFGADYFDSKL